MGNNTTRNLCIAIGLGQLLSVLNCGTAVTSGLLQRQSVVVPTAQSFLNYVLLCLVFTTWLACRRSDDGSIVTVLKRRGWKYLVLAFVDVEANYLIVKAYHYTTVTSVQILDCFTIPVVLFLSWLVLRVRYKVLHFVGVATALVGVGALILADVLVDKYGDSKGSNKVLGDLLCLGGAALYGVSNVGQEFVVRNFSAVEFLGMIGLFGSIINGVQFAILERNEILEIDFTSYKVIIPLVGFAMCLFFVYSLMPVVLSLTSAASVNLNLLSADFYTFLFGLFLFHDKFHVLYIVSFGFVISGVIVYSMRPPPNAPEQGDYREMRPTDDPEPPVAAGAATTTTAASPAPLGPHTGVAYHTQRHNTANHTAESSITEHNNGTAKVSAERQNGAPVVPAEDRPAANATPVVKKVAASTPVPHSEQYTRLSIVQDDERLS